MPKENNILNSDFIDFELFVAPGQNSPAPSGNIVEKQKILVGFENEKEDPELEALLKNILSAAKIDIENQVLLIKSTPDDKHSFVDLLKKRRLEDSIFFGIDPQSFGIGYELAPYRPLKHNNRRFLKVDSLKAIHSDIRKKKALWNCLQEMYLKS